MKHSVVLSLCILLCISFQGTGLIADAQWINQRINQRINRIEQRGKIVFLVEKEDSPPFLYHEAGSWLGEETVLINSISRALNLPWEIRICGNTAECLRSLEKNIGDILISGQRVNLDQARFLRYSLPYADLQEFILIDRFKLIKIPWRGGDEFDDFLSQFPALKMGVTRFSAAENICASRGVETAAFSSYDEKINSLFSGEVDACIIDSAEYDNYFKDNPEKLLFYRAVPVKNLEEKISFAVYWHNEDLLRIVNTVIRSTPRISPKESQ